MINLYELTGKVDAHERVDILFEGNSMRIERIVSPAGFVSEWYDQEESEWLTLLQGTATLEYGDNTIVTLFAGDTLTIPPHIIHRVIDTSENSLCIWLCIFFGHNT